MPGDPKRAERMARQLMPDATLVTDIRGMLGFTGTVNGQPLTVMGSGMGMPSAVLYATELFQFYGVQRIIRVGTCGGIASQVKVGDVVVATGAHAKSSINAARLPGVRFAPLASFNLVAAAVKAATTTDGLHVGAVISSDHFYFTGPGEASAELLAQYGVLGVEMEAAGIFGAAAEFGREALAILTVSDHLLDDSEDMTADERETRFQRALSLAVAAALS